MNIDWHAKSATQVIEELRSSERGLSQREAARRLKEYGPNQLPAARADGLLTIFFRQFESPLIYILLVAGAIVLLLGEAVDAAIIMFVLLFNAVVGTIQEGKAQNTLAALKSFTETRATVLRDGQELIIPDQEVTPGDIIILQEGERVPADGRVIFSRNLKVDEAALTGESEPVHKVTDSLPDGKLALIERKNMVFKGTHVVAGHGQAAVVGTGLDTTLGRIAREITTIDTEIPLKTNIRYLSRLIIFAVVIINVTLFGLGILSGKTLHEMFITVVSLSVSVIPEGLPIVMTLVLATGVWRMAKRQALIKHLPAVEALGQARVIAVDKTGTITKNELAVRKLYVAGEFFEVTGVGYEPKGEIKKDGAALEPLNHPGVIMLARAAAFSANASVMLNEETGEWRVNGDPTEAALLTLAEKIGFHKVNLERESPFISEIPFDYKIKYHAAVHQVADKHLLTVAGAPEVLLKLSTKIWRGGQAAALTAIDRAKLEEVFSTLSQEGLRVLALAIDESAPAAITSETLNELTFIGFVGLGDTLRPEVHEAMSRARLAGIRVIMITGDHRITARVIAQEAGIYRDGDEILTGEELETITEKELAVRLGRISIFARVTPEHKLRIIQAFRKRGEVVAMTGDGVNDAPSLVAADLGVAMGKIGTEVAKEASDIVLLDDNFGSIISAVEEGRSIYKTIKKVILYLFSTSTGEVLTLTGAILLGYPLPILPAQIIWLNLVTDGFLDVALAMEPKEDGLLRTNFERPKKYLIDKLMSQRIIIMAVPMMVGTLILFRNYINADFARASTIALTTLAVFQWFNAWNCRSEDKSIFQLNFLGNKFLVGATAVIILFQLLAVYHPLMQKILRTAPLTLNEWLIIISIAGSIIAVEEIRKFFYRRSRARKIDTN